MRARTEGQKRIVATFDEWHRQGKHGTPPDISNHWGEMSKDDQVFASSLDQEDARDVLRKQIQEEKRAARAAERFAYDD